MKLELKTSEGVSRVLVDGIDLSEKIIGCYVQIRGGEPSVAILKIPVNCIDIEGDFDIYKDAPKLSCIGDYGNKEIVKPLNNTDWINKLAQSIANGIKFEDKGNIILSLDGETIGKIAVNQLEKETSIVALTDSEKMEKTKEFQDIIRKMCEGEVKEV